MLFNSLHFLVFFPLVTGLYFWLPHRSRWVLLLCASCYFYMVYRPAYILILAFTILVDYWAGLRIEGSKGIARKRLLWISIAANVGVLAFFKYFNFLSANVNFVFERFGSAPAFPLLDIALPIGLSFHTFQAMSYTIEVYRGKQLAERHLGRYALYVMFYPQLVAGPIERPQNLLHQFRIHHEFDYRRVADGLSLMAWGFFKKVVIADRLAPFVNVVYDDPTSFPGVSLLIATVFFAFQIYCDFSGYSDIAIGSARVMGFTLMTNFRQPYFSSSVGEFWRRWHISLSTWFKDYVYIPLGGGKVADTSRYANLMITFLISGLWHGASWTFVIWGGLNGVYLIGEQIISKYAAVSSTAGAAGQWVIHGARIGLTFLLILVSWVFFRSTTLTDALYVLENMFRLSVPTDLPHIRAYVLMGLSKEEFLIGLAGLCVLFGVETLQQTGSLRPRLAKMSPGLRWAIYATLVMTVAYFGSFNRAQEFIYFQF
jgi:alginate O-acetyltransferase complex protein AlgI